jgi:sigma-B regulation protein RsbU (phosphoserine phosphatase)
MGAAVLAVGIGLIQLLGIHGTYRQPYTGMAQANFLVARVDPGSPAEACGIRAGDVIQAVDGVPTSRQYLCRRTLETAAVGERLDLTLSRDGTALDVSLALLSPTRSIALQRISLSVVSMAFLLLGLALYLRRTDRLGLLFYLLCSAFAVLIASSPPIRNPYVHTSYHTLFLAAQHLMPAFFLHFFLLFPEGLTPTRRRILGLIYIPALLLICLFVAVMIAGGYMGVSVGRTLPSIMDAASSLYMAVCLIAGVALFVIAYYRNRSTARRRRLRVALWGTVAGVLPIAIVTVAVNLNPSLEIPGEKFIVFFMVLIPASFAYAIVRHKVLDVQLIIRKSLVYSMLTAVLLAVFFIIISLFGTAIESLTGRSGLMVSVIFILIVAIMANPLRDKFQTVVDQLFFRKRHDSFKALKELGEALSTAMDLDALVMILVSRISTSLGIERLAVYVRERTERADALELKGGAASLPKHLEICPATTAHLESTPGPVALSRLRRVEERALEAAGAGGVQVAVDETANGAGTDQVTNGNGGGGAGIVDLERKGLSAAVPFLAWGKLRGLLLLDVDAREMTSHQRELLTALAARAGTAIDNALLYRDALERHRLEKELSVATRIQEDLLPKRDPVYPSVDVSGSMIPSHEVGGDYYDYVELEGKKLGVALGDVTGKGIPAALLMAAVQATIRADAKRSPSPSHLVSLINKRVQELEEPERFATFFYCTLDTVDRTLTYCNAGHHPPILVRADGSVEHLMEGGMLLGFQPNPRYDEGVATLNEEDILIIFTDGIVEQSRQEEFYGEDRLVQIVRSNKDLGAAQLKKRIVDSVLDFSENGTNEDDLTLVVIKAY